MWKLLALLIVILDVAYAPPVEQPKKAGNKPDLDDFGLEYGRYLQQVVTALEEDKEFAKRLENVTVEQIKSGIVAKELEFVKHNVRTKLDELKRIEMDRLRKLIQEQMERTDLGLYRDADGHLLNTPDGRRWRTISGHKGLNRKEVKIPQHLDVKNPSTFEINDLKKLIITATSDLEEIDRQRREEFKKYELEKEATYREGLKNMTSEEKKKAEEHHEELVQKHKEHPKVHHPGSKPQLEQVWEDQDNMPKEEFNPKTFFAIHDVNEDGHLDVDEVEAILLPEVRKMYNPNNEEDDPTEMVEEYHRMREHIFNETDKNKDALISLEEFLKMTEQQEFQKDEGWKGLDEQQVYSEQELEEYMRQRQMHPDQFYGDQRNYYDVGNGPGHGGQPNMHYQGEYGGAPMPGGHPQQPPYQGHPQQFQGHPQQFPQGHPQQFPQGHPEQFQQGHQQFQPGLPQGHPQQFQQGYPQQGQPPQYQQGHPPQYQQGQPPQYQQGQPPQYQQGQPPQYQQIHPQQAHPQQGQQFQAAPSQGQAQQFQAVPQAQPMGNNVQPPNPQVAAVPQQQKPADQPAPVINNPPEVAPKVEQKPTAAQASNSVVPPKPQS